jgi:hypothetical protein
MFCNHFYSTALKIDSFGNKFDQPNQIDCGAIEDLDDLDILISKTYKYHKRGVSGSKRTVGGRLCRNEESKQHHKSPKVESKGINIEDGMRFAPETENLKLPAKKRSLMLNNSELSSCEESQEDINGTAKRNVVSASSRLGFVYPQRAVTARDQVERDLMNHVKCCKYVGVDTSFLDFFAYKNPPQLQETTGCQFYLST